MEYKPRYAQPFTLSEVVALDVSVITDEIARLYNSLKHLRQTQEALRECVASESSDVDPEFIKAIEENEVVIGSQEERIGILKLALAEKGVIAGSHYDPAPVVASSGTNEPTTVNVMQGLEDDYGIHL